MSHFERQVTIKTAANAPFPTIFNTKSEKALVFVGPQGDITFQNVIMDQAHPSRNSEGQTSYFPLFQSSPGSKITFENCSSLQSSYFCDRIGTESMLTTRKPPQELLDADNDIVFNASLGTGGDYMVYDYVSGPKEYTVFDSAKQSEGWIYFKQYLLICDLWGLISTKRLPSYNGSQPVNVTKLSFEVLHLLRKVLVMVMNRTYQIQVLLSLAPQSQCTNVAEHLSRNRVALYIMQHRIHLCE